ncbi:MAG: radical SAM protein [Candidatus Omnitrophica bacterium]|nr:radical SAM protein [Candidatus Omnitrophota bacterium]
MLITKKRKAKFLKSLRFTKLPAMPFILNIEPGNLCNLKCPLCPTGLGEPDMAKGFMELDFFKRIFDQLKNSITAVNLYSWGEPLLNKDLVNIIRYIKTADKPIRVVTSTNLNIRDDKLLAELIASGIDEIIVSCDGASRETYEQYRVGGDFDLVMRNLRFLAREKEELAKGTRIVWNFLVFKHNEHEVEKARAMAKGMGVEFRIGLMRTSMKDEILKSHKEAIERDQHWIPDNPAYSAYDKTNYTAKKIIKSCRKPWQEISINWNGLTFPCCAVYGEKYHFGDARKDSIKAIWNNPKFVSARKEILNKKRPPTVICGICRDNGFMHM